MSLAKQLSSVALFAGISEEDITSLLTCLCAKTETYAKGEYALLAGDPVTHVGIVLHGEMNIFKEDQGGDRSLMAQVGPGDHFAEVLCCAGAKESPVSVRAEGSASVLLLDFRRILTTCKSTCVHHAALVENMLRVIAKKSLYLQARMETLSQKTIRKKLLHYLHSAAAHAKGTFSIPFSREELADYLCVDRSALSRELSRLKEEGVVDYHKSEFKLL